MFGYKKIASGEGGIRTLDTVAGITVFETARFNRSRTSPNWLLYGDAKIHFP